MPHYPYQQYYSYGNLVPSPQYCTTASTTYTIPLYTSYTPITSNTNLITTNLTYNGYQPIATDVYQDDIWQRWVNTTSLLPRPTVEQQVAQNRALQEQQERRDTARTRARILLAEFLSEEQKGELERHGRFHVTGSKGRRYCIRAHGQSGNIDLLKPDGSVQATLCAHPGAYLPDGDAWLMQMIELRHDEDHFLQTANVHRGSLVGV